MSVTERFYSALLRRDRRAEQDLPAAQRREIAPNGLRQVTANALQASGDQIINPSTVLPWLFAALNVPPALTGVLVPIREAGSMLPQAFLTPWILRARYRKWVFVLGALVQAGAVALMVGTAVFGAGLVAGLLVIGALAIFALGRCLCSVASKDVQGRTIPKGERGQLNGLAVTAAGMVAITLGVGIRSLGGDQTTADALAWLLAAGVVCWVAVAAVYASVREPADEYDATGRKADENPKPGTQQQSRQLWAILRNDQPFRRFVTVRGLLLVSALSPPFIVTLSIEAEASSLTGLGGFIIASGLASLIGGRVFGRVADRSSKKLMRFGAAAASAIIITTLVVVHWPGFTAETLSGNLVFVLAFFAVTLLHTGVRIGRKTYVVDMAAGDQRTIYVAVANTAMGVMLLVVGGLSSLLAAIDIGWALVFLAVLGFIGVAAAARLPDVSRE